MEIYVVTTGDNVSSIAAQYGVTQEELIYANQLLSPYRLAIGQALLIPTVVGEQEEQKSVYVNGFAYPFISNWVLEETLPFLTSLSVFSYGFTPEGNLIPPILSDERMILAAIENGVRPVLTLTPFGSDGNFNNELISQLLASDTAQATLWSELLTVMGESGFTGLDIDFEFILAQDRDLFTEFVRDTTVLMNENGYTVSVDVAPKTSSGQQGLLYEGKDYRGLGEAANTVLVMTYEWGYTYGPPLAVAPIPQVRAVLEYALSEIPKEKINMGIPNYGYDWPLPYVRGETKARTIGNVEAVQLALYQGVPIMYDEVSQSPYFNYEEDGVRHEVWFEDVRSMQAKFSLLEELELRGFGYWQIMQFFRANWLLLESMFRIIQEP